MISFRGLKFKILQLKIIKNNEIGSVNGCSGAAWAEGGGHCKEPETVT